MKTRAETLAAVLAEHTPRTSDKLFCLCGHGIRNGLREPQYHAHVAAALDAALTAQEGDQGEGWDYWHAEVCSIGNSYCSAHQTGVWPHLVHDGLAKLAEVEKRWHQTVPPASVYGRSLTDIIRDVRGNSHD